MRDDDITYLVVGGSLTVPMGVPVGQQQSSDQPNTLRWQDGRWQDQTGLLDKVKRVMSKPPTVLQINPGAAAGTDVAKPRQLKWSFVAAGLGALVLGVGWLLMAQGGFLGSARLKKPPVDDFSAVPDAGATKPSEVKVEPVRSVDAPWIRAAPEQVPVQDTSAAVPVVPGSLVVPAAPAPAVRASAVVSQVPLPPAPQAKAPAAVATVTKPSTDTKQPEKSVAEAVILDIDPGSKGRDTATQQPNLTKLTPQNVSRRPSSGLVALTPDGKAALFTNPSTRLPEKFGVGEKLPSGEMIKSIDVGAGVVKTDMREYHLE